MSYKSVCFFSVTKNGIFILHGVFRKLFLLRWTFWAF